MSAWDEHLETFIRWVMRDVTYHKHYSATVQALKGDNADVIPDDDKIKGVAGLQNVPVYWGTPGIKATVAPGARVTLFFEDGNPKKPRIIGWQSGAIKVTLADGGLPVARVGDTVTVNVAGATGTGIIAAGNPQVLA
jgi:hypothetical protein